MHTKWQILRELSVIDEMGELPKGLMDGIKDQEHYRPSKMTRMCCTPIGRISGWKYRRDWESRKLL